jgi:hypothetical protein
MSCFQRAIGVSRALVRFRGRRFQVGNNFPRIPCAAASARFPVRPVVGLYRAASEFVFAAAAAFSLALRTLS